MFEGGNREANSTMTVGNDLKGRVALVTGGGRNIGRAIALALAAAGAAVVINGRRDAHALDAVAAEIAAAGGEALPVLADVADAAAVEGLIAAAAQRFGRLDILINNAAVRPEKALEHMTLADWHAVLAVNLDGAFLTVKSALPHLRASGAAAIVNIGGVSGHAGAKQRAHVVTAKAGLVGFTRALAHELAGDGITANCVVPGLIDTERDPSLPLPQHHQVSHTLLGRLGSAEEIAAAVCFLSGPGARYITGQTLHVNGGVYLG
ncbi:MAG TPA: SDR family NAD(P)-dependent oxidoreductase [Hyphomicrobiaceae bacterium]|nr:SDR family NAD(P)-dependent oxidoreductase [Hyphomicrobiaceae bacterium]